MKKDLKKKEKLLSLNREPVGKNNLSSRASFMQEKLYDQKAFSNIDFYLNVEPVNFYYDAPFYGRIDDDSFAISPKKNSLVQIRQADGIVKCQNFVNDAFNEFYNFWQRAKRNGLLNESGILYNIDYFESYKNPERMYLEYIQKQNIQFYSYVTATNSSKQIRNFKSFLRSWTSFVEGKLGLLPFTYSSFYLSKFADQRTSGLIIDLADEDKTDDNKKYNKYINDPNYLFFYNSINNFGFNIDKKIPWRIVANIDSNIMKNYMNKYNINNSKDLYIKNYHKVFFKDLKLLKIIINELYLQYVSLTPSFVNSKVRTCQKEGIKVEKETIVRDQKLDQDESEMMRVYLFLKAKENNLNWDQAKFNSVLSKTIELKNSLDTGSALRYMFKTLNVKSDSKSKNTLFSI
jgi:hypothetical protein